MNVGSIGGTLYIIGSQKTTISNSVFISDKMNIIVSPKGRREKVQTLT